ncbi:NACHT domain-containing protein [Vacuolonema iberomarrocanum]|uniref:NACHT domain-containing protein n=1 Tax=Vacuolonema iberomarrocanum TaxID=3454632 RepID=UPI0019F4FEF4|nr:NACHT domain-containing protein [filamentous cyanobacterium LEGE 07170]
MSGFEPIIAGLSGLVLNTVKETAQEESGSTLARLLNKDIGKALEQQVYNASGAYLKNYQERHGTLKVTCVRMDAPMELDKLYTTVQLLGWSELRYFASMEGLEAQFRESGRRQFQLSGANKESGISVANRQQFLMVLGGPGIGKSTLLRKVGLEALKRKQGSYDHECLPVFLPLQRFKDVGITIEQRIAEEFKICGFPEPEAVTTAMLKKGKLLVLLDGLDEVAKDLEDAVIEQIRDFVDRHRNNRFMASCRVAAYKGGFPRFKDVAIAPFEEEQIEQFIRNWFSSEKDQENETADQCWKLLKRPDYAATRELAQTPLLLTLLCAVYDKQLDFPKNRASLYGEALDVVLKEWAAEKRIHNDPIYRDLSIELERELLAELAFDSFVEDQLFFEKGEVTRRIREFLVSNVNAPKHLDSEKILEAIEVQQGILTERARNTYSFSHLTFQEYLTAQHIVDNQQVEWLVENHLADQQWREVFLLVAGLMPGKKGVDPLLMAMEQQARQYLDTPILRELIQWADRVTANSQNPAKSAVKRVGAIFLARARAHDLVLTSVRNVARDLSLVSTISHLLDLDLARDLVGTLNLAHALDLDLAIENTVNDVVTDAFAKAAQRSQIIDCFSYANLIQKIDTLRQELANKNIRNISQHELLQILLIYWSGEFQFNLKRLVELDNDEKNSLGNYFYPYELMIRCKEAAVRVSPEVWQAIEGRMFTLPKEEIA